MTIRLDKCVITILCPEIQSVSVILSWNWCHISYQLSSTLDYGQVILVRLRISHILLYRIINVTNMYLTSD